MLFKKNIFFLVSVFFFIQKYSYGQDTIRPNNKNEVFLELGGAAGVYSLNYQREIVQIDSSFVVGGRLGIYVLPQTNGLGTDYSIPFGIYLKKYFKKHSFEFGVGELFQSTNIWDLFEDDKIKNIKQLDTYLSFAYQFNISHGFFIKLAYTPHILFNEPDEEGTVFGHWAGLTIGFSF